MHTQQELRENWNHVKGRIQERWGQLDDDDLDRAKEDVNQLIALIQHKTGESPDTIAHFIDEAAEEDPSVTEKVKEVSRQYAEQAQDVGSKYYQQAADTVAESYQHVQSTVRERPTESMALTFAAGVITGTLLGVMLRSR